jgi:predicted outer membrane repeat protein
MRSTCLPAGLAASLLAPLAVCLASAAQALTVTAGFGPDCDFDSPAAALAAVTSGDLEILLQGRPGSGSNDEGVYRGALVVSGSRTVSIRGVQSCSDTSPPAHRPRLSRPQAGEIPRLVTVSGGDTRLMLDDVDIVDTRNGGIAVAGGARLDAHRARFAQNRTPTGVGGAAIDLFSGSVFLGDVVFVDNESGGSGGAIACENLGSGAASLIEFESGEVAFGTFNVGNRTALDGGAIFLGRHCILRRSGSSVVRFENNIAGRDGGAIALAGMFTAPARRNILRLGRALTVEDDFEALEFITNFAARDGGALHVGSQAELELGLEMGAADSPHGVARFLGNEAGRDGGAIAVLGPVFADPAQERGAANIAATYLGNRAQRGGALWVDGGRLVELEPSRCRSVEIGLPDRYCNEFVFNTAQGSASRPALGGAVHLTGGSELRIAGYHFFANDARLAAGVAPNGSVASVEGGSTLRLAHSLLHQNGHDDPDPNDGVRDATTMIDLRGAGNHLQMVLSTMVEQRGAEIVRVQSGASARFVGTIAADNTAAGISAPAGAISGVCNRIPLSGLPPPADPSFVPAPGTIRGRFRLADDSPMRAFCKLADVQAEDFDVERDLDGIARRIATVNGIERIDAGAFTYNEALSARAGCVGPDLEVELLGGDQFFHYDVVVFGSGPELPMPVPMSRLLRLAGPGVWSDLRVEEQVGDRERLHLGHFACGLADPVFGSGFE